MKEVMKSITIESASGLAELGLQNELSRQATLAADSDYTWPGNDEPGAIIHFDNVTLYNVKFITSVEFADIDITGATSIKIDYIAYEK